MPRKGRTEVSPVCHVHQPSSKRAELWFPGKGSDVHRNGNEGSLCRALAIGSLVLGDQIMSSRLLDGLCCSSLSGEEGKAATFLELIRLYYFLSGKPEIASSLLLWEFKRSTLRNSQTIFWDLCLFNHLISILGNFKPAYSFSPYLQSES